VSILLYATTTIALKKSRANIERMREKKKEKKRDEGKDRQKIDNCSVRFIQHACKFSYFLVLSSYFSLFLSVSLSLSRSFFCGGSILSVTSHVVRK